MKNRLEVAREFLREDGVIFIQCDDNEQAYLKVLCDEIFGRENFVNCIAVINNLKGRNDATYFKNTHEYILYYKKNCFKLNQFKLTQEEEYEYCLEDEYGLFKKGKTIQKTGDGAERSDRPNLFFPIFVDENNKIYLDKPQNIKTEQVLPLLSDGSEGRWTWERKKFLKDFSEIFVSRYKDKITLYKKQRLIMEDGLQRGKDAKTILYKPTYNTGAGVEQLAVLINNKKIALKMKPKSESLICDIIEISTNENDLVMDFFAGSGTTLAVAMKMKRRFVGIEQMHYVESITKERLKKVVAGEQGGISKAVGWSGGGGFVYAELMPLNAIYKEKLINASDEKELEKLYKELETKAFVDYRADIQDIVNDREFHTLALEEKKEVLKQILDANMDYVPYADIDDTHYEISEELKRLNRIFYKEDEYE